MGQFRILQKLYKLWRLREIFVKLSDFCANFEKFNLSIKTFFVSVSLFLRPRLGGLKPVIQLRCYLKNK